MKDRTAAIGGGGRRAALSHAKLRRDVKTSHAAFFYRRTDFLALDYTTLRHLEILEPLYHDALAMRRLRARLNKTVTPMGARLFAQLAFATAGPR